MNIPPQPEAADIKKMTIEIVDMLASIKRGALIIDFHDQLAAAIRASHHTNKQTSITMTLKLSPDEKTEAMRMSGKVTSKLPAEPEKEALFFVTPDFKLTRMDHRQVAMFPGNDEDAA